MIAAIDPGLDRAVAALFDPRGGHSTFDFKSGAACYVQNVEVTTSPGLPLVTRLNVLSQWARRVSGEARSVIMEQPTIFGVYARNRNAKGNSMIPRGMAMLYMAMGALIVGIGSDTTTHFELVPKPKIKKVDAHRLVVTALKDAGCSLSARLLADEDGLDAIFIGLWAMSRGGKPNLTGQRRMEPLLR